MKSSQSTYKALSTLLAVMISLALAVILIIIISDQPLEAVSTLILSPLSSVRNFGNVVESMITLLFTGLAISIMFQAGQFNVGVEGVFFFGGLIASYAAINLGLGSVLSPLLAMLAGALVGALFMLVPGLLKAKLGADELVVSLMLNYVLLFFGTFILNNYLRDPQFGAMATHPIPETSKLPVIIPGTRIHAGLIVVIVLTVVMYLFVNRTKTGFTIRITGHNERFAAYSGVNIGKVVVLSQVLGGAIGGLGGAVEVMGMYNRFQWVELPGYGWDGVVVAILAGNKPQFIPLAAFFMAYLRTGSNIMGRSTDVPRELIIIIQAVIILLVSAGSLLDRYQHRKVVREVVSSGNDN